MRLPKATANDPVIIGYCAGCGNPIYSNEQYLTYFGDMIHAEGVGAVARIVDNEMNRTIQMSCVLLYIREICEEDKVIEALGMTRCGEGKGVLR